MANALNDERHRGNGFTFLRLFLALIVIYAHSFAFGSVPEPVKQWSNGTWGNFGIAVDAFFVISGFLVWRSMIASAGPWSYLAKRGLRLLPALVTVMVLSVLLGAAITTLSASEYWSHPQVWYFLTNPFWMLRGGVHFDLPGVFAHLPIPSTNASLWTIPFEIFFYLLLLLPFVLSRASNWLIAIIALVYVASFMVIFLEISYTLPNTSFELGSIAKRAPFFIGGAFIAYAQLEKWFSQPMVFLSLLSVLVLAIMPIVIPDLIWYILLPPLVIGLAYLPFWTGVDSYRLPDISYGVYLSGWPIQQLLFVHFGLTGWSMVAGSMVAACAYGLLSWKLVEAPALAWKRALPGR
jgi:peptidoglycan/LPS O-acetylase OafA/YrhL